MMIPPEKIEAIKANLDGLIAERPVPDPDYVIKSGAGWVQVINGHFRLQPMENPLKEVAIYPAKLANRVRGFTGGQVVSVTEFLLSLRKGL